MNFDRSMLPYTEGRLAVVDISPELHNVAHCNS